jgi:hypothetical protein
LRRDFRAVGHHGVNFRPVILFRVVPLVSG